MNTAGDAAARGRRETKFRSILDHVGGSLARHRGQWMAKRNPKGTSLNLSLKLRQRLGSSAELPVTPTVSRKTRKIDLRQQAKPVQLGRRLPPLVSRIACDETRRIG